MPKWLEDKLKREGKRRGLTGKRLKAYIYGTMQKEGLLHKKKKK